MDALGTIGIGAPPRQGGVTLARRAALGIGVYVWVSVPYYLVQHFVLFRVTPLEPSTLDRMVPFHPWTAPVYLSFFLLLTAALLLITKRNDFERHVTGVAFIALVSNLIFLLYPTSVARPAIDSAPLAYQLIVSVDRPLNACPSLHAALAVFAALSLHRAFRSPVWKAALWIWTLAILYATLATRQHVFVDLAAGAAISLMTFWWLYETE